ncbi:hypothetical protein ZIOFF_016683 [Zingiber officinale]|uniref:Uncharacterized protein n=1 Tax=Zingiber officinale TaxID=94328 RepID=A0A8J5LNF0_ZINOF|nr:hypothetical protein ZIOFF_016683 [Zingiber officinale]
MAREFFESVEVWLPAEFLCDDIVHRGADRGGASGKIRRIPFGFAKTEERKEDEDHMARLTKQMAHHFLQDDDLDAAIDAANKSKVERTSTTSSDAFSSFSYEFRLSSHDLGLFWMKAMAGSAAPSPPAELWRKGNDLGDLLHEAAAQAMRLRQIGCLHDRGFLLVSNESSPPTAAPKKSVLTPQEQLQAARFYHLSRQLSIKQQLSAAWHKQQKANADGGFYGENRHCRPPDLPVSAWTPLRKPPPSLLPLPPPSLPGSGMRAAFLGAATGRKESVGTGVFIPRTAGNKLEAKKITGTPPALILFGFSSSVIYFSFVLPTEFSTVFMPEKVAQALNQNIVNVAAPTRFTGGFLNSDAFVRRESAVMSHHRKPYQKLSTPSPSPPFALAVGAGAHETGLPQEWTY